MSTAAQMADRSARRARLLRALDIVPWVPRTAATAATMDVASMDQAGMDQASMDHASMDQANMDQASMDQARASAGGELVPCVVVLPAACATRELDLLGRALTAAGSPLARAPRLVAENGQLGDVVPEAHTYLVFGEAQAHALGRVLSAQAMHRAQIVLADEPALILNQGGAKRRLWSALRNVRRALKQPER